MNFLEFLSTDEYNLLVNLTKFKREFSYFTKLDNIYQKHLKVGNKIKFNPNNEETVIAYLYLYTHYHFYFTFSCYLRLHLAEAFISLRKAIDSALTAYYIIENPSSVYEYIKGNKKFENIKRTIQNIKKNNSDKFPLSSTLIKLHEKCSEYGGHADFTSFTHRIEISKDELGKQRKASFGYSTIFKNKNDFTFYFLVLLKGFLEIFKIFKIFFNKKIKIVIPGLEQALTKLEYELLNAQKNNVLLQN